MPLSIDLRRRVIHAIDSGESVSTVAERFEVAERTIYNWLNLRAETGSLIPKPNTDHGHSHKIIDWQAFSKFAQESQHLTLAEMAKKWQTKHKTTISLATMWRALKKMGYTSKKKLFLMQKQTRKNENNI